MTTNMIVFAGQAMASTIAYLWIYCWFVAPRFRTLPAPMVFTALFIPNLFRHVGATTMSPAVVAPEFADRIGFAVSSGDVVLLLITYAGLVSLRYGSRLTKVLCWAFVVIGMLHNVAVGYAMISAPFSPFDKFGAHWYVGTFIVPLMVMTELVMIVQLVQRGSELP